jgi:exo-1,4-beta-D-glucosaminidase
VAGLSGTYFLRLELKDGNGETQSINWYWLSKKQDELQWKKSEWFYTPQSDFSDYTALKDMPSATLEIKHSTKEKENKTIQTIDITNTGKAVAFFIHVRALKG